MVGHRAEARYAREMAAVLACGRNAVISHRSAAAMMGLLPYPATANVWITQARGDHRKRPGIRVHAVRVLWPREVRHLAGVPLTSPARTLLDLAAVVAGEQLERAVAEALVRRRVSSPELREQLRVDRGRRGAGRLRRLLDLQTEPAFTRSEAERRFLRLIRSAGLPEPLANARVGSMEVDFLWPRQRVVVEIDGRAYHSGPRAFERDRVRDNELQLRDYVVLRFTWLQLTRRAPLVRDRLHHALHRRDGP